MKKKNLKIQDLAVNSFVTSFENEEANTVKGKGTVRTSLNNDPSICDYRCITLYLLACTNAEVICA